MAFFRERSDNGSTSAVRRLGVLGLSVYSYFEKLSSRKNVHATIPKGYMGYVQYTVPDTVAVEPTFVAFL